MRSFCSLASPFRASVLSLKFMQQFDNWKSFEQQHSEAEAHLFGAMYGPNEVGP